MARAALPAALLLTAGAAEAEEGIDLAAPPTEEERETYERLTRERGLYGRVLVTTGFGRGMRFNNPFRLETQLGDTAQSPSLTATYHDVGIGAALGDPEGLQHGAAVRLSIALEGVPQQAVSLSYLLTHRDASPWLAYGRLGLSVLTQPDANAGGELSAGLAYFLTGALGVHLELVGNLFYGAGIYDEAFTTVPVLSVQGGLITDLEVLP